VNFITETTRKLDLKNLFEIRANVFSYLARGGGKKFDIVFADPPYDLEGIDEIPDLVLKNEWLAEDGWFIMEHSASIDFSSHPNLDQHRKYGKVNFSMFSV
jgi:16S rRNA G966 N2-methylase RsmD